MKAPALKADASRLRHQWRDSLVALVASSVLLTSVVAPVAAQPMGLPSMGSASSIELSPALEQTLGGAIMEQGRRDPSYIADLGVSQYLTSLGQKLVAHAPERGSVPITVFGLRDPQINAFALPGGFIGINSGLVVTSQSEAELASVVAHEIAHVLQRHIARGMTQRSQSSGVMMAAIAGALLAALAGSADLAMGVAAFGQAAAVDRQLGFSRQAEQEADRTGFEMLRKAGFDPLGGVRMFNHLSNASRLNEGSGGNVYTSTHPLSLQRMSDMQNRAATVSSAGRATQTDTFWYVRAKLRVLQARGGNALRSAVAALQTETNDAAEPVKQAAAWYGLAYAAFERRDFTEVQSLLDKARALAPKGAPELDALAIRLALERNDSAQALQLSQMAIRRWPNQQELSVLRAQALQKAGQDTQAVPFLEERIRQWPDIPQFYQLLASSLERLNEPVKSRRIMARYYELTGALPTAIEQLTQARSISKDFYVQSELDQHIRTLKERVRSDRELLERFKS